MSTEALQIELEEYAVGLGINRYRNRLVKHGEEQMPPGLRLMRQVIQPLAEELQRWIDSCLKGRHREYASVARYLNQLDAFVVAHLVSKVCIHAATTDQTVAAVALNISRLLVDEIDARAFYKAHRRRFEATQQEVKKATTYRHKRNVMRYRAKKVGVEPANWNIELRTRVGTLLLHMFLSTVGLLEIYKGRVPGAKFPVERLRGTEETLKWFREQHGKFELLTPIYQPMVIPPKDWTTPFNGGYLTLKLRLIKSNNRNYLEELRNCEMPQVYRAINTLQRTPWKINRRVYDVFYEVWTSGGCLGKLPQQHELPLPPRPEGIDEDRTVLANWKHEAAAIYERNARSRSQRQSVEFQLTTATRFLDVERFYFPYTMDWRGRLYPVPVILNPQGNDLAKGLLMFADGKPLGKRGADWLKVHCANLFGIDKVSVEDRVAWVDAHKDAIIDSALNPLDGERFWATADKPYQALAACFELYGYWTEGESFVSHLPIAMDGSCNGIQNFSAMLRDYEGGCAVNLVPQDTPQDIYAGVAEVVARRVEEDARKGVEHADLWVGKITRSIVKRPVMTLPYGATRYGMRQQIIDTLKKMADDGECPIPARNDDYFWPAEYLSWVVYRSIGEVVRAARQAMDWLQQAASVSSKDGMPIHWITPAGLPVLQAYYKTSVKRVRCLIDGRRVRTQIHVRDATIDSQAMAYGSAPNFVHSMDASHLMLTVNHAADRGVTHFCMVHDSYATHAADSDTLAQSLREMFVYQYQTQDVLAQYREHLVAQVHPDLVEKIPPLPERGNLDLNVVKYSMYFFA